MHSILAYRMGLFDISNFNTLPIRNFDKKISGFQISFRVTSRAAVKNATIVSFLTQKETFSPQQSSREHVFSSDFRLCDTEADLSPSEPLDIQCEITLDKQTLKRYDAFTNGPFLLQVEVSSDEFGAVNFSGNNHDSDNAATFRRCSSDYLLSKDGGLNCRIYVHKLMKTPSYSLDEFVD